MCTFTRNVVCGKEKEVRQNGKAGVEIFLCYSTSLSFYDVINRSIPYIFWPISSIFHYDVLFSFQDVMLANA